MRPNRFSIHLFCSYKNHQIRAEKRSLFFTMEYSLVIDGVKQDQLLGTYGIFSLHGMIEEGGEKVPVEVIVHQGILFCKFFCKIKNELLAMEKYIPGNC